jgi:hypothetical protein
MKNSQNREKMGKNQKIMQNFTIEHIPNLDICTLAALELFSQTKIPKIKIPFKRPLVVGSGNAIATGRIIFSNQDAIYATESTFKQKLKHIKSIDGVVLISASGEKHAPIIAKYSNSKLKQVILITNNQNASAIKFADQVYIFPKNREPYTYNTSTYMGPILAYTKEDPKKILNFINKSTKRIKFPNFKKYQRFYIMVPEQFEAIIRLLHVKFIELFGRQISRDIETFENTKHATTVVPSSNELFISFGKKNTKFGDPKHRLHIPLPSSANYVAMMAIGYFVIGQIQKSHPPYFKQNIVSYMKSASKMFKKTISPIVE